MTIADFESFQFVENPTPNGSTIKISVGCLLFDGDETEHAATYFEIKDKNKNIVTQFALCQESFGVFLNTLKELYSKFDKESKE